MEETTITGQEIALTVKKGLTAPNKYLPSWLLYDEQGDLLFQKITKLPEYYLTRCEREILVNHREKISKTLLFESPEWDIIELGAGDGTKTKLLLESMLENGLTINYYAIDISENVLKLLENNLKEAFPSLSTKMISTEYFEGIDTIKKLDKRPKLVLFMGANIGNFELKEAEKFLGALSTKLNPNDILMIGFDLIKSPTVITAAYNDSKGITREFNFNLLKRLNKEYNGNFLMENFEHYPTYNPYTGSARSYIISAKNQEVYLKELDLKIELKAWEPIYTEISQKYSARMIEDLAKASQFKIENDYRDFKSYFSVTHFRKLI